MILHERPQILSLLLPILIALHNTIDPDSCGVSTCMSWNLRLELPLHQIYGCFFSFHYFRYIFRALYMPICRGTCITFA